MTSADADAARVAPKAAMGSQSLERGIQVLRELSTRPDGLTVSEVAEATHLHRSIANRLLISLVRTGFAFRDDSARYRVGPELMRIAGQSRPQIREVAEPVLHALAARIGATASLVEVVGDAAVATVVAEPATDGPRFSYRLGNRDPLDRGAGGIAALASAPASAHDPERVTETRERGFVTSESEINPGAYGLAAPIPSASGVRASVNIITNRSDLIESSIEAVVEAARQICELVDR